MFKPHATLREGVVGFMMTEREVELAAVLAANTALLAVHDAATEALDASVRYIMYSGQPQPVWECVVLTCALGVRHRSWWRQLRCWEPKCLRVCAARAMYGAFITLTYSS